MELYSGCRNKRDINKAEELVADLRIQFLPGLDLLQYPLGEV
jgi:hypothetical protein